MGFTTGRCLMSFRTDERISDVLTEEFAASAGFGRDGSTQYFFGPFDDGGIHRKSGTFFSMHLIGFQKSKTCILSDFKKLFSAFYRNSDIFPTFVSTI
jgi:hypothetical protein